MHAEYGEVPAECSRRAVNTTRAKGGRIVCVGTHTFDRLLESATSDAGVVRPFAGETAIFITPGYRFRATDGLVTNFHLPRSPLFMLVAAARRAGGHGARRLPPTPSRRATDSIPTATPA